MKRTAPKRKRAISTASVLQRAKVLDRPCLACGREGAAWLAVDPAHLCARAHGGCDSADCVVPLCRDGAGHGCHRMFDEGQLDLLPYLVGTYTAELLHALGHYDGDLLGLLHRLTGEVHVPQRRAA